jgi:hypothetical protein
MSHLCGCYMSFGLLTDCHLSYFEIATSKFQDGLTICLFGMMERFGQICEKWLTGWVLASVLRAS